MNETKYYKSGRIYYKLSSEVTERVYAYLACFGIESKDARVFHIAVDDIDGEEITEAQYNRVRRLILKKLQNV